jgi:hypothetical protein
MPEEMSILLARQTRHVARSDMVGTPYFTFQSEVDSRQFGFASDEAALPQALAPWRRAEPDAALPSDVDIGDVDVLLAVAKAIKADGYCVLQADPPNVIRVEFPRRLRG